MDDLEKISGRLIIITIPVLIVILGGILICCLRL